MTAADLEKVWALLKEVLSTRRYRYRVKLVADEEPSDWTTVLIEPTRGYVEPMSLGPVLKRDVEWVEIDPVARTHVGRLVPPTIDNDLELLCRQIENVGVAYAVIDGLLRIGTAVSPSGPGPE